MKCNCTYRYVYTCSHLWCYISDREDMGKVWLSSVAFTLHYLRDVQYFHARYLGWGSDESRDGGLFMVDSVWESLLSIYIYKAIFTMAALCHVVWIFDYLFTAFYTLLMLRTRQRDCEPQACHVFLCVCIIRIYMYMYMYNVYKYKM